MGQCLGWLFHLETAEIHHFPKSSMFQVLCVLICVKSLLTFSLPKKTKKNTLTAIGVDLLGQVFYEEVKIISGHT